jgi:hypothetical protein
MLAKIFVAFFGSRWFYYHVHRVRHWSPSRVTCLQSTTSRPFCLRSILMSAIYA